jgi:hypothetical protein
VSDDAYIWTTAQIEAERRRISEQVTDTRIALRHLADRRVELYDKDRANALHAAALQLAGVALRLDNAKRTPEDPS